MTIQNRDKELLMQKLKEALKNDTPWMDYRAFEKMLRPRTVSFHKTPDEAKEKVRVWSNLFGEYKIMPALPLFKTLRLQLRLESFGIVQASPLRFDPAAMTDKYLRAKKLPVDLLTKNNTIVGTSHVLSDELFTRALAEISKGNSQVVYDSSRHLLGLQEMHFLKDEGSAKLFMDLYLPSAENLKMFKAVSLMDIYDHFEVGQIIKTHHVAEIKDIPGNVMQPSHIITNELMAEVIAEIQKGNHFATYNVYEYMLDRGDMMFFKNKDDALEFSINNSSDADNFDVIKIERLEDVHEHFRMDHALQKNETILSLIKNFNAMEENNYEQLKKSLFYTGYGEALNEQLKEKMMTGEKEFLLQHTMTFNKEQADAVLHFRKSDTSEMYFFNKHELSISKGNAPEHLTQTFYINHMQDNITLKEGLNMLQDRAVYKELTNRQGEKYNAWVQLDFKEHDANSNFKIRSFNEGYGFKLEEVLAKYPITALKDEAEKKMLMESLQRGNRQSVTLEVDGKSVKAFIEASPQYKGLNFYDQHMKKVMAHELTAGESVKNNVKAGDDDIDRKQSKGQRM